MGLNPGRVGCSSSRLCIHRYYALLLFRINQRVLYSAQYHRPHCTLQAYKQFRALYICTTTMTNIRPDGDSNLVPPGYNPQSIRMSHRGPFVLSVVLSTIRNPRSYSKRVGHSPDFVLSLVAILP